MTKDEHDYLDMVADEKRKTAVEDAIMGRKERERLEPSKEAMELAFLMQERAEKQGKDFPQNGTELDKKVWYLQALEDERNWLALAIDALCAERMAKVTAQRDRLRIAGNKMAFFLRTWADCLSGVQMSDDDFDKDCGLLEWHDARVEQAHEALKEVEG